MILKLNKASVEHVYRALSRHPDDHQALHATNTAGRRLANDAVTELNARSCWF